MSECNKCNGTLFVCENHPDQEAHQCKHCGGAGMPCECTKISEPIGNTKQLAEPVAVRYDFDGYGYIYMDAGSGSDWASRVKNCEFLYTHPQKELVVSREPKIGDRVILLDDESEGVIESLSIAGGPRINFDDGCYGNYTRVELITLFAYKESE